LLKYNCLMLYTVVPWPLSTNTRGYFLWIELVTVLCYAATKYLVRRGFLTYCLHYMSKLKQEKKNVMKYIRQWWGISFRSYNRGPCKNNSKRLHTYIVSNKNIKKKIFTFLLTQRLFRWVARGATNIILY